MEYYNEDIEPEIDCENTICEECGYSEWCNTYQDELHSEDWDDCDYDDNEDEDEYNENNNE